MAAPSDVEQPAESSKESSRKHRASYESTYTGDGSHSNSNSNSNTKSISIKMPLDPSVLAMVSAARDADSDDESQKRQSQLFCFFCCDLVKACIIMNAVHIVISIIHILISVLQLPIGFRIDLYERYGVLYDDDNPNSNLPLNPWGVIGYLKIAFGFLFAIIAIIGARRFSQKLILASVFWDCCYTILSIANQEWSVFFISIPFLYTDVHLYMALRSRNITPENYEDEKHCCCAKGGCS